MERLRVGDLTLAYDVRGDGPPMVLLHGAGERAASWDTVRDALAQRFTTYAVDLRGHGDSDWPGEYRHALIEADVCALLDAVGLSGVVLVGHSLGGNIGFRVAAHRPDLVARLVVEDVIPPWPRTRRVPPRPDRELDYDWDAVPALMGEASTRDDVAWDELGLIVAPTLLVSGGAGSHLPVEKVAEVVARIPDCVMVEIDAGHHVHRREPGQFLSAVLGWLAVRG
ncbi:alpha/beta fold hydrolase [Nocardioides jiangxiensis]|uniref:Alpha/beta hydrolase n=1 Tax=Nocardioides jiangxiensis TaxID=3064524 RepID=A0ABT9B5T3_9ACTN|nr:alpha/beta hydrolase [Nocardioides sp. WY-20]MDO7868967.1 alpha/beta hydrolase [Nocardioides sp. WY-20]